MSESTIYRYIHEDREKGGELYKSLPHSGKPYKKKVKSGDKTKIPNRVGIEQRPAIADEKTEFGHRKRRYLGRYFAHPMMQNRRAKRDDYKSSAVRVTQRYVP
ncbi:Transposase, IS30 family (plasmid) [Piscirickettsia salmonis]|nr:hypothetical protein [Piscirickettsia salmonis]QGP57162.1 Transposase, IS30 family [Piscirickettsia salmonis]